MPKTKNKYAKYQIYCGLSSYGESLSYKEAKVFITNKALELELPLTMFKTSGIYCNKDGIAYKEGVLVITLFALNEAYDRITQLAAAYKTHFNQEEVWVMKSKVNIDFI